jgi:hypothetical protein
MASRCSKIHIESLNLPIRPCCYQGLPVPTVGTSMAVAITHVFLWGSRATNHIENALMGSPWLPSSPESWISTRYKYKIYLLFTIMHKMLELFPDLSAAFHSVTLSSTWANCSAKTAQPAGEEQHLLLAAVLRERGKRNRDLFWWKGLKAQSNTLRGSPGCALVLYARERACVWKSKTTCALASITLMHPALIRRS